MNGSFPFIEDRKSWKPKQTVKVAICQRWLKLLAPLSLKEIIWLGIPALQLLSRNTFMFCHSLQNSEFALPFPFLLESLCPHGTIYYGLTFCFSHWQGLLFCLKVQFRMSGRNSASRKGSETGCKINVDGLSTVSVVAAARKQTL